MVKCESDIKSVTSDLTRALNSQESKVASEKKRLANKISDLNRQLSQKNKKWDPKLSDKRKKADKAFQNVFDFIRDCEIASNSCQSDFLALAKKVSQDFDGFQKCLNEYEIIEQGASHKSSIQVTASWYDTCWWNSDCKISYQPKIEGTAPGLIRVGTIRSFKPFHLSSSLDLSNTLQSASSDVSVLDRLPLLINCTSSVSKPIWPPHYGHTVIYSNNAATRRAAVEAIESIALRAFATFPARKLEGIFVDPISMGNTFPFKSLPEEIRGKRTFTTSADIQEELLKLITHTEHVIQTYLSRDYNTIEEYNAVAEAIQEAYRFLFIADFPNKFDGRSLEYLNSLLINGAKAGVYTIIPGSKQVCLT